MSNHELCTSSDWLASWSENESAARATSSIDSINKSFDALSYYYKAESLREDDVSQDCLAPDLYERLARHSDKLLTELDKRPTEFTEKCREFISNCDDIPKTNINKKDSPQAAFAKLSVEAYIVIKS